MIHTHKNNAYATFDSEIFKKEVMIDAFFHQQSCHKSHFHEGYNVQRRVYSTMIILEAAVCDAVELYCNIQRCVSVI